MIPNWRHIEISYHKHGRVSAFNQWMFNKKLSEHKRVLYCKRYESHQEALVHLKYFEYKEIIWKRNDKTGYKQMSRLAHELLLQIPFSKGCTATAENPNRVLIWATPDTMLELVDYLNKGNTFTTEQRADQAPTPAIDLEGPSGSHL